MINFAESIKKAFEDFQKCNSSKILSSEEKKELGLSKYLEAWEVVSEVTDKNGSIIDITFFICFPNDFPLVLPKIYLSKTSYDLVKYIPHVDDEKLICTFDDETIKTDPKNPSGITYQCFKKAKSIIESGLKKENFNDFEEEFVAYWENSYSEKDLVKLNYLSLLPAEINSPVKLITLSESIGFYSHVLHQNDDLATKFIAWLKYKDITYFEKEALYIGEFDLISSPSFSYTNKQIIELLTTKGDEVLKSFKEFIKKNSGGPLIIFSKKHKSETRYYGWLHKKLVIDKKGFRPNSITVFKALSEFQKNENVIRISTQDFTPQRLQKRSIGNEDAINKKRFFMAGLGSIGSNLIPFLDSIHFPDFYLVDNDLFKVENTARHLLGIDDTGRYKTEGIKYYLLEKYPNRNIETKNTSIIKIINESPETINANDFMFVCIGKDNVENYIGDSIKNKTLTKPVFFIWIEPYLTGGHFVFINPKNNISYSDYFDADGYFKFNIIDAAEYKANNKELSMKEAGCQSSYIPFSNSQIVLFLSALFPYLFEIIHSSDPKTCSYSWVGNKKQVTDKGIKLSELGVSNKEYSFSKNEL